MQGEDPQTTDPRDARSWINVYEQMIEFKLRLMNQVNTELSHMPPRLRRVAREDVQIIDEQLQRYQKRLEFWYSRHFTLAGILIDHETRTITHAGRSVQLTGREHQLLNVFLGNPDHYYTARQLVLQAWHDPALSEEELRIYIGTLRRKLKQIGLGKIINRPSRGYALLFG
jgi:DNA-binding response OmpR family regulator